MVKIPGNTDINEKDITLQRKIQLDTTISIINKLIAMTVTVEIRQNKDSSIINVTLTHRNFFSAIKN